MTKKTEKTSKKTDTTPLEAIVGRNIVLPGLPEVVIGPANLIVLLGAYSAEFDNTVATAVTSRDLVIGVTRSSDAPLLDVSGVSSTGSDGKSTFRLTQFVGWEIDPAEPIHTVATPRGATPLFLTTDHQIRNNDVEVTVYSWDANGNPAPNVAFDWRCRIVSNTAS